MWKTNSKKDELKWSEAIEEYYSPAAQNARNPFYKKTYFEMLEIWKKDRVLNENENDMCDNCDRKMINYYPDDDGGANCFRCFLSWMKGSESEKAKKSKRIDSYW